MLGAVFAGCAANTVTNRLGRADEAAGARHFGVAAPKYGGHWTAC